MILCHQTKIKATPYPKKEQKGDGKSFHKRGVRKQAFAIEVRFFFSTGFTQKKHPKTALEMVWKHEPRSARHNEILHFEKKKGGHFFAC